MWYVGSEHVKDDVAAVRFRARSECARQCLGVRTCARKRRRDGGDGTLTRRASVCKRHSYHSW